MKSVYEYGTRGVIGAIRMPARPATTALITQLNPAMRSGEMWETYAPFSVSAASTRVQSEPREPVARRDHNGQRDHGDREPDAVRRHAHRADDPHVGRKDRRYGDRARSEALHDHARDDHHHSDRRHRFRDSRRATQRTERRHVEHEPEYGVEQQCDRDGARERHWSSEVDRVRQPGEQQEQLPLAEERVHVGARERHRAGGEVDDSRAPVRDDERERERGEDGAVREAEQQEDEMLVQVPPFDPLVSPLTALVCRTPSLLRDEAGGVEVLALHGRAALSENGRCDEEGIMNLRAGQRLHSAVSDAQLVVVRRARRRRRPALRRRAAPRGAEHARDGYAGRGSIGRAAPHGEALRRR